MSQTFAELRELGGANIEYAERTPEGEDDPMGLPKVPVDNPARISALSLLAEGVPDYRSIRTEIPTQKHTDHIGYIKGEGFK